MNKKICFILFAILILTGCGSSVNTGNSANTDNSSSPVQTADDQYAQEDNSATQPSANTQAPTQPADTQQQQPPAASDQGLPSNPQQAMLANNQTDQPQNTVPQVTAPPSNPALTQTQNTAAQLIKLDKPVAFDRCGSMGDFKSETWYGAFSDSVGKFDVMSLEQAGRIFDSGKNPEFTSPQSVIVKYGKVNPDSIGMVCYSGKGNLVIAVYGGGGACGEGNVFRYDTVNNVIEKAAILTSPDECGTFAEFGKRKDGVIPVIANLEQAGTLSKIYYDYNFVNNTIKAVKKCDSGKDKKEECTNY